MSRRLAHAQRPRVIATLDNPYQGTTLDHHLPHLHAYNNGIAVKDPRLITNLYRNEPCIPETTYTDTHSYYDCGYHTSNRKDSRNTDYTYSDESDSTRRPYCEHEDTRRLSRDTPSDRSLNNKPFYGGNSKQIDVRKVYPNQENACEMLCYEGAQRCVTNIPKRTPGTDRPQSSQGSSVTSAVVHGCGGKCQTFENVCYYFLQVAFTMGILIGTSLCIAGAVLRKSAARNLQVLVYIGALLSLVSALLLSVQCSAKHSIRQRKKTIQNAKRSPIVLEPLPPRPAQYQQQPLMGDAQRSLTVVPMSVPIHVQRPPQSLPIVEQPGVPWWRRKDLITPQR